jgi:hypothetical protein
MTLQFPQQFVISPSSPASREYGRFDERFAHYSTPMDTQGIKLAQILGGRLARCERWKLRNAIASNSFPPPARTELSDFGEYLGRRDELAALSLSGRTSQFGLE